MKKIYSSSILAFIFIFCTGLWSETFAQCNSSIPSTAIVISSTQTNNTIGGVFWICSGDTLTSSSLSGTYYLESGAALISTGLAPIIYVASGAKLILASGFVPDIYYVNPSDLISYSISSTLHTCASITFNYASAPAGGCPLCVTSGTMASGISSSIGNAFNLGESSTLAQVGGTLSGGAHWAWYKGGCGSTLVDTGETITVSPSATTTYYVRAEGACNTPCASATMTLFSAQADDCGNNAGFEDGSTAGWTCMDGYYNYVSGACPPTGTCPAFSTVYTGNTCLNSGIDAPVGGVNNRHTIVTAAYGGTGIDPNSAFPNLVTTVAPGGGNYSFRLGNNNIGSLNGGALAEAVRLTFGVTAANAGFTYRYAAFLQDPGHPTEAQPRFEITVLDSANNIIPCGYYKVVSGTGSGCPGTGNFFNNGTWRYTDWTSVGLDLTGYIGHPVSIEFRTSDCLPPFGTNGTISCTNGVCTTCVGGSCCTTTTPPCFPPGVACQYYAPGTHSAYAYIDAYCSPLAISAPKFCAGAASIQICAPPGYQSYTWPAGQPGISGTQTTQCVTINNPVPGTVYQVDLVSVTGCPTTTNVTLGGTNAVVNDTSLCAASGNINLNVSPTVAGTYTYQWTGPGGFSSTQQNPNIALPTSTSTYSVTVSDTGGCSITKAMTINILPKPVVTVNSPGVCNGSTVQLTATGGTGYSWNPSTGLSNPGISNPNASPTATTTYTVAVTDASGCVNTATSTVTVNPLPVVSATPATICVGTTAQLSATGGTNYTWSPSTGLSNAAINNPTANPTTTTTYTVTVTNANGCVNKTTATVTVNPLPVASAAPASICIGATAQLSATGGITYSWSPSTGLSNPGINNPTANPTTTTTYTITVSNGNCANTTTATVTVNPLPVASVAPATICLGATAQLSATGGTTYSWSPSTGLSNPGINNPTANPTVTTTYTVTVTNSNGCVNTTTATVAVNPFATVNSSPASICIGQNVQLSATGGSTYTWSPPAGLSGTNISNPVANPSNTTTYSIQISDANGCTGIGTVVVTVNPLPAVSTISPTICIGTTAQLSATGGTSYSWNPSTGLSNAGINNPTANPTATTTYSVTVTNANGCVNTTTATVTVNPLPVVSAAPATICIGATAQLSATGGITYSWNPSTGLSNGGINNPTANPTATTTYSVIVTNDNGCVNTTSATVTVNPLPVVSATPATICIGGIAQLSATGGIIYSWSPPADLSNPGINNPTATPTVTTTYTVIVTDGNGCINSTTATVTISPFATVNASPATICIGQNAQLSASGGVTYTWSPPNGLSATNVSNPTANPSSTTTYSIQISDVNGCTGSGTVMVTVNPLPIISASPATICIGDVAQISASGGTTYSWNPSTGLNDPGISNPTANPTSTTTYTVTVADANGCVNTTSATVTVNALPFVSASPATICIGEIAQLSATGGTTYSWKPSTGLNDPAISNPTANPTSTTTYTVTVADANGCVNTTTSTVTINPLPVVSASPATICIGDIAQLSATGGITYSWNPSRGLNDPGISNPTANPTSTTTYTVTAVDANGCVNTANPTVTVNPLPVVSAAPATICIGATAQLSVTGGTVYLWNPATDLNDPNIPDPTANPTATTTYTVTVTDANGCVNTTSATVTVNPFATVNVSPETICVGENVQLNASGGVTYTWSPATGLSATNISNPVADPSSTTTYSIEVTDANGCTGNGTVEVTVNPLPVVSATPATICFGETAQLSANGGTTYSWNPSTGLNDPGIDNPVANPTSTTTYTVTVADSNGCVNTTTATVTVNPLPVVSAIPATICIGDVAQLSATGGTTYSWSPSAGSNDTTISNPTANPTSTTTYSITSADGNGCVNTTTATVTVNPLPLVSATPVTICIGGTAQLSATGGTIYSWNPATDLNDPNIPDPTANPTATTTYTVTVTDANGCVNTTSATVTVNPFAIVNVSPATICLGQSAQLSASGGVTYTWSPATGLSATNISNPVADPSITTTYSIEVTDVNGCTGNGTVEVTVNPLPVVSATPATICFGETAQLSANGGTTYSWNPSTGLNDPGIDNPVANPTSTTTYTVTVADSNGCVNTTTATVTVNPLPVVSATSPTICIGDRAQLNATGGNTYSWNPSAELNDPSISNPTANPTSTTTYSVIIADGNGCENTTTSTVTVNPLPVVTATPVTICIGGTAQLSATGGTIYSWNPSTDLNDPGIPDPTANPTTTTTYTVTVTDANGCVNTTTATVTVNPFATVNVSPATICLGQSAQLSASGGVSYTWSPAGGLSGTSISDPIANPSSTTTYSVEISDANGCRGKGTALVTVNPLPVVTITPATICLGSTAQLTATGGTMYTWNPSTGLSDPYSSTPDASPTVTTNYTVSVTDTNSCVYTDTTTIVVIPLPVVIISPDTAICLGNNVQLTSSATGAVSYSWTPSYGLDNTAISNPIASPSVTTSYVVDATNANGCHGTTTVTVTVDSIQVWAQPDHYVCVEGGGVMLTASGGTTYLWSPPDYLDDPTVPNPFADPPFTTTYTVIISDGICTDTAYVTLHRTPLPTPPKITRNGDTLSVPPVYATYQWYLNGLPINGATNYFLPITQVGNYSVFLTDSSMCRYFSSSLLVIGVSVQSPAGLQGQEIKIFPNPSEGKFTISFDNPMREVSISIFNCLGQVIFKDAFVGVITKKDFELSLAEGMYLVQITACPSSCKGEHEIFSQKLIIQ